MEDENDQNDSVENEGAGLAKADAEPSDADLLEIIGGGGKPEKRKSAKAKADADEELDESGDDNAEDAEAEESDDGDPPSPKRSGAASDESEEGQGEEDDESEQSDDDDDADAAAGDDDPDAALDDEDKGVRAKFTPEQQAKFDRAVSKKTRRILELKTELREEQEAREAAESRATELEKNPAPAAVVSGDNPLAAIEDEPALDKKLGEARKLRRFALANPDGAFIDQKTGEVVEVEDPENPPQGVVRFTKKRIGEILAETEETLQEHGPKHRKFLQDRAAAEADAVKTFPFLKNRNSAGYSAVETTLRHAPVLRSIPGIKHLLADAFVGRMVRLQQQQAQKKGQKSGSSSDLRSPPSERKAPPSPGGGARPPKVDAKKKVAGLAGKTLAETGDDPGDAALRAILKT